MRHIILLILAIVVNSAEGIMVDKRIDLSMQIASVISGERDDETRREFVHKYFINKEMLPKVDQELDKTSKTLFAGIESDYGKRDGKLVYIGERNVSRSYRLTFMIPYEFGEMPITIILFRKGDMLYLSGFAYGSGCAEDLKALSKVTF
jgi:hypothetical protein